MTYRKKKLPWLKSEYVVLEEHNEVWLVGSFMRAMARKAIERDYDITICLGSREFIDQLRVDPSLRDDTFYAKEKAKEQTDKLETKDDSD